MNNKATFVPRAMYIANIKFSNHSAVNIKYITPGVQKPDSYGPHTPQNTTWFSKGDFWQWMCLQYLEDTNMIVIRAQGS